MVRKIDDKLARLCSCIDLIVTNNIKGFQYANRDKSKTPKTANFTVSPLMVTVSYSLDLALSELIKECNRLIEQYNQTTLNKKLLVRTATQIKNITELLAYCDEHYDNKDYLYKLIRMWAYKLSKAVGYGSYIHSFCPEHPQYEIVKIYGGRNDIEYYCGKCDTYYTQQEYEKQIHLFLASYVVPNTVFVTNKTLRKLYTPKQFDKFKYYQKKGKIRKTLNGYDLGKINQLLLNSDT